MRRLTLGTALAGIIVLVAATGALTAPTNDDELLKEEQHRLAQLKSTFKGGQKAGEASGIEVVGHHDLGGRGFNADIWFHEDHAYVGHWGFTDWASGSKQRFCPDPPNNGVAVVDATDPSNPAMVSRLVNPTGTSAEDVVVYQDGSRDIAVAGIQVCGGSRYDTSLPRGLMLWDVTTLAAEEQPIGFVNTGCCTRGVHEFEVERHANGRTYAYATVPASEYEDPASPTGFRDQQGRGDFRLIDVTDPANPFEVSDWGVIHDMGGPLGPGQGCDPDPVFGHGAEPSDDGTLVFLSYWDSGFVALDVSDPANLQYRGDTDYEANEDGDGHSAWYDQGRELLFSADEDFCLHSGPEIETGNGYLRIWDYSNLGAPVQIGEYRTPNSMGGATPGSGDYTIHNPYVVGTDVYISWYSDGVRVVDASDPTSPEEVAYFVPPAGKNPVKPSQRGVLSQTPQVWGVVVDEGTGLIYASDMNSGLWILRRTA
jgi:hypothetical protein